MASTNLKTSLFFNFQSKINLLELELQKKKFALFTILNLFINERDCGQDHCFLTCSRMNLMN